MQEMPPFSGECFGKKKQSEKLDLQAKQDSHKAPLANQSTEVKGQDFLAVYLQHKIQGEKDMQGKRQDLGSPLLTLIY